jgi:competence protein ComEA
MMHLPPGLLHRILEADSASSMEPLQDALHQQVHNAGNNHMSFKTTVAAIILTASTTIAIAQQAQQPQQSNPLRPNAPTAPAAPAQPTAPAPTRPTAPTTQAPAQQAPAAQPAQRPATAQPAAQPGARTQLVNLNTAPKTELETLPQIGPARADAIIKARPIKDWNDLVARNVIPSNAEAAIKDKVKFR